MTATCVAILLVVGFLVGCHVTDPLPVGATPFSPLSNYSAWWSMTEACSGLTRPMSSVSWYSVSGSQFVGEGDTVNAYYSYANDQIVIGDDWATAGDVVRHEMLHALIHRGFGPEHPRQYFLEKCAGVVWCNQFCVATSDPPPVPPVGTPVVAIDSLELSVSVDPDVISLSADGGLEWSAVTVTARNPVGHDVLVTLPPDSGQVYAKSFAYSVEGLADPMTDLTRAYDSEGIFFRAGESKRFVFDIYLFGRSAQPGTYQATGSFGGHPAVPAAFRVIP
jgi:hypothetical protein